MFFEVHKEKKIGFKELSFNDLGVKPSGKQTHIGLYDGVLTFMPDNHVEKAAILIYEDYCEILNCDYGKILRKAGDYNSPNIKSGDRNEVTLVNKIREFSKIKPRSKWYLIWFGLDSEELVFWLVCSTSSDFQKVKRIFPKVNKVYDESTPSFNKAIQCLERKINGVSQKIQEDLEVASQIGDISREYKPRDIEKAEREFKETGLKGEEIINEYLDKEKFNGLISSFYWVNKNGESGLPYDFVIDDTQFVDVKSTKFGFDHLLFFSDAELRFANSHLECYNVFRVYDMRLEEIKLRKCRECLRYMNNVNDSISSFQNQMTQIHTRVQNIKIGVKPTNCFTDIESTIII